MEFAPIILFTYCRPDHTKRVVEALKRNKESAYSDLIIFSDGPKKDSHVKGVLATRNYLKTIDGFKSISIIERTENWGLAKNLTSGITEVLSKYNKAIIVEDDILTSPFFLQFMNECLIKYEGDEDISSIHGYLYKVNSVMPELFITSWIGCWGWATWRRAWSAYNPNANELMQLIKNRNLQSYFNMDDSYPFMRMLRSQVEGTINSWAIRWYASNLLLGRYSLNAGYSLVQSIGNDGNGGTHCSSTTAYDTVLCQRPLDVLSQETSLVEDKRVRRVLSKAMLKSQPFNTRVKRIIHLLHLDFLCVGYLRRLRWN